MDSPAPPAWIVALLAWVAVGLLVSHLLARAAAPPAARAAALLAWPIFLSLLSPAPPEPAPGPNRDRIAADLSRLDAAMRAAGISDPAGISALRRALSALDQRAADLAALLRDEHARAGADPALTAPIEQEIARCARELDEALSELSRLRVRLHLHRHDPAHTPDAPLRPALQDLLQRLSAATERSIA